MSKHISPSSLPSFHLTSLELNSLIDQESGLWDIFIPEKARLWQDYSSLFPIQGFVLIEHMMTAKVGKQRKVSQVGWLRRLLIGSGRKRRVEKPAGKMV